MVKELRKIPQTSVQLRPKQLKAMKELISEEKEDSLTAIIRQSVDLWLKTNYEEKLL